MSTLSNLLKSEGLSITNTSSKNSKLLRLLDMVLTFFKVKSKTDVVLIDTYSTQNFYYAYVISKLCKWYKILYVPILHGGNLPNRLKHSPKLSASIFKNAMVNVSPSLFLMEAFKKAGYTNLKFIPNTLEIKKYQFQKKEYKTIKLLWVRAFAELYNPTLAVKVLKTLKDKGYTVTLCMIGPEKDQSFKKTKALALQLNVEVEFTGKLTKQQWIAKAKDYNIFINTTNFDNMPVSVIEAMALGLPVVSTNVGGLPYLIKDGETGFLVEPNNANAFADSIETLINQSGKTNQVAINARNQVETYDWEIVKKQWFELLNY